MATKKQAAEQVEAGKVKARVIFACHYGAMDAVVELGKAEAEAAQAAGSVDTHPESVAYAESLKG
jgi:L-ascorbate metabolism protein UlaG (beta-lactamase superfamily)